MLACRSTSEGGSPGESLLLSHHRHPAQMVLEGGTGIGGRTGSVFSKSPISIEYDPVGILAGQPYPTFLRLSEY